MGRRLEERFRVAFLRKVPRLGDRYFQSRPISDMAERCHGAHAVRAMPGTALQLLRGFFSMVFTAVGITWLDPASGPVAACIGVVSVALPLAFQRSITERDLRVRSHVGALGRYYLDALLGLMAIRTHSAEASMRREHAGLLGEWARASRARDQLAVGLDTILSLLLVGMTGWLFLSYYRRVGEPGAALLLLYWVLSLPAHGRNLASVLRQIPGERNSALRLLEPLGALEEPVHVDELRAREPAAQRAAAGVALSLQGVAIVAGGHTILSDVTLDVPAGAHVAIVGPSGAGKSSLVGLLLGWHRAARGALRVDGSALGGAALDRLRACTAWVDPQVQLWNRSLLDNLAYGAGEGAESSLREVIDQADLRHLLETLPEGLATPLGEGGGLVSGGEGQRVRFGRGALRTDARLVILDEPFRGLDRTRRAELLGRARRLWARATLLCITHDVGETMDFERVVVVDAGRVVEDGNPRLLSETVGSRYASLLEAEAEVRTRMWASAEWRRFEMGEGVLEELPKSGLLHAVRRRTAP